MKESIDTITNPHMRGNATIEKRIMSAYPVLALDPSSDLASDSPMPPIARTATHNTYASMHTYP